jgi:hypothetical protein
MEHRPDIGLSAATAFGKTVIAAWLIAERAVNTLSSFTAVSCWNSGWSGYRHF